MLIKKKEDMPILTKTILVILASLFIGIMVFYNDIQDEINKYYFKKDLKENYLKLNTMVI